MVYLSAKSAYAPTFSKGCTKRDSNFPHLSKTRNISIRNDAGKCLSENQSLGVRFVGFPCEIEYGISVKLPPIQKINCFHKFSLLRSVDTEQVQGMRQVLRQEERCMVFASVYLFGGFEQRSAF